MAAKIERMAAKTVFDPPTYTQTIKVTGAQTIVFISGQVDPWMRLSTSSSSSILARIF